MKKFLLFGGDNYYPAGGWGDFLGDFDTLEEARAFGKLNKSSNGTNMWDW